MTRKGLNVGSIGVNVQDKRATIVDSGDEKFQTSNLAHIGRAVAGILKHPEETANKYLATASFNPSQNEIVGIIEELTGEKLKVTRLRSEDLWKSGEEKLAQGDFRAFGDFLKVWNHADGSGHSVEGAENANQLLGVPYEDLRETLKAYLTQVGCI